jgi:hypothetical protein
VPGEASQAVHAKGCWTGAGSARENRAFCVYYRASDGSEPVDEFIEALRDPDRQAALDQIERLNMLRPNDPPLPFPWSSQLEGELRELRCH